MTKERWGTLSVRDHTNAASLVPEVLLYDHLVFPVPSDEDERQRWKRNGWAPEILYKRLEALGDLAIRVPWNAERQKRFRDRMEQLKCIKFDADEMVRQVQKLPPDEMVTRVQEFPYLMTRMILAQDQQNLLSKDVSQVVIVAAYQSRKDLEADFILQGTYDKRSNLGLLLGQKLAVPSDADAEKALLNAIELSHKSDFKRKRQKLYGWQESVIRDGISGEDALDQMNVMIDEYNQIVEAAVKKVKYRFAFTVAKVVLGLAGAAVFNPLASALAFLSIAEFATLDRKPVIAPGDNAPAAMFHDAEKVIEWRQLIPDI